MSDTETAGTEEEPEPEENPQGEQPPYTLQVFLLRGDPDSDPTEVAGDAWQFDADSDDDAMIAAQETLVTEYGGIPDAQGQPGEVPTDGAPPPQGAPGPAAQTVPGGNQPPQGGPAASQPAQPPPA